MVWGGKVHKLQPETLTQIAIVRWFRLQYPGLKKHLVMIGNGGKKPPQGHLLSERMGEVAGASDLFLAFPSGDYCGFWIEVKREKFKMTKSNEAHVTRQISFIETMREVGYDGEIVIGSKEGIDAIKSYMAHNK